jgi:AraC family transcriptional regulator
MAHLQKRELFSGPLVTLIDVRCRESSSACSGEEHATGHQLIVIRSGVFVKHSPLASRRALVAEPMQVLFLNRNEPFRISHPTAGGDDCTVLDLSDEATAEVIGTLEPRTRDRPDAPFRISHAPLAAPARLRLHRLRRATAQARDGLALEESLLGILARVAGDGYRAHGRSITPQREATRRAREELVERTRQALAVAPAEPWSLSRLARQVDSSPYHLTRVFRASTGLPVHQYLLRLRLALALEELEGGGGELSAIALRAGFASHSHFTTAFRHAFGVRPSSLTMRRSATRRPVPLPL